MLEMAGISKSFLGVPVLRDVDLDVAEGSVHALVGENGAGKSTLMKILAGVHRPDGGVIRLDGTATTFSHPGHAHDAGVAIIYQELTLLPERSVADNVFLGREPTGRGLLGRTFVDRARMRERTRALLNEVGVTSFSPEDPVWRLSVAQQQVVEIVKALSQDARIIVMDEPTAALADHEVDLLYALVRKLHLRGISVLYISHRLREVFDLCDHVTVLKDGALVASRPATQLTRDELVRLMVGRELSSYFPPRADSSQIGDARLRVAGGGNDRLRGIDLTLRAGEITGVAGLQGSGRSELAHAIFGAAPFTSGTLSVDGAALRLRSPSEAVEAGIALVTEDRKTEGLALEQSVRDNALLALRAATRPTRHRTGPVSVRELLESVRVRTRGPDQEVRFLSGGNQQKVVLAKWLAVRPRVLIFDEPTRGVDVGAKATIHDLIRELAAGGAAVCMISSELPELVGMSDRIVVLHEGAVAGELPAGASEESVMRLATGHSEEEAA